MSKETRKLKKQFIKCVDRAGQYFTRDDEASASSALGQVQRIYEEMVGHGQDGKDALLEIINSNNQQAAILCCTFAYGMYPEQCLSRLEQISEKGNPVSRHLAETTIRVLRMGYRFDRQTPFKA